MRKTFLWISRHPLNDAQKQALAEYDEVIELGDIDAFDAQALTEAVESHDDDQHLVVGVVHPAAALTLFIEGYDIAVARNINRAEEGEPPKFEFAEWRIFQ